MAEHELSHAPDRGNEEYTGAVCLLHMLTKTAPVYEEILVDVQDFEYLRRFQWRISVVGSRTLARRVVRQDGAYLAVVVMDPPPGMVVDHIFHRLNDNRRSQLRVCTQQENNLNTRPVEGCSSRFKGVWWNARSGKWYVQAGTRKDREFLGSFTDEVEAARAYNEYAKSRFGSMAYLNPI